MRKLFTIFSLFALSCSAQVQLKLQAGTYTPPYIPPTPIPGNTGAFTFTLGSQLKTSAGVFRNDSILVKTLWNDETISSGSYTRYWDGTDDYGNVIPSPDANYKVKVLSNNVQYDWQGTIGNTSDSMTGISKHRGYFECMSDMAFTSTHAYFSTGYSEGVPARGKFALSTPNKKIVFSSDRQDNADIQYVATDGAYTYWGAFDAVYPDNSYVFATRCDNDNFVNFSSGSNYNNTYGMTYNTVSYRNAINQRVTGLAVQKTGDYLFICRSTANEIKVLNKTTGATVQTVGLTSAREICIDGSDNVWLISGTNTVARYTVNTDGTLTSATLTLTGLVNPLSVKVNNANNLIAVADGSSSQQVKFFNSSTGALISTLGTSNGYYDDATVNNNKFYFSDAKGDKKIFIAFQQNDDSYWVNDFGNNRIQHYSSSNVFINRIMALGASYNVRIDPNNINRVFSNYMEFNIDYSTQVLTGNAGWTLVKNWGAIVSNDDDFYRIKFITTLSNGRTYAFLRHTNNTLEVVELGSDNKIRFTGVIKSLGLVLLEDGSIQELTRSGISYTYKKYPLLSFDGSGNPVWGTTAEILATAYGDTTVGNPTNEMEYKMFSATKSVFFQPNPRVNDIPTFSTGYHLGIMNRGSNTYLAQTEKSTHRNYSGDYPAPGWFDCGNMVYVYAGGTMNILDRNIITSYHGEFWKNMQTNWYNHYYDNGLAIGQFGTDRNVVGLYTIAAPKMAGNALTPIVVKDSNGDLYLYHGDESDHSGVHRWKITGLNTVNEITVTIPYPLYYITPTLQYFDLMTGLPFDTQLINGTSGWDRYPVSDITTNPYSDQWLVRTSKQSYDKKKSNDVTINAVIPTTATYYVSRDLGTNNVVSSWELSGKLSYPSTAVNYNHSVDKQFLEVLDVNGKVLTTTYLTGGYLANTNVYANTIMMATGSPNIIEPFLNSLLPYKIVATSSGVTFSYGNFTPVTTTILDPTADWSKPKLLRLRFENAGSGTFYGKDITIQDFKFYKDY